MNGWRLSLKVRRVGPEGELRGLREWRLRFPAPSAPPAGWVKTALIAAAAAFMVLAPWYFERVALADRDDQAPVRTEGIRDLFPDWRG